MKADIKAWQTIFVPNADGYAEEGVIVHVAEDRKRYWWIPCPEKDKHGGRLKHHIKAPRSEDLATLDQRIDRGQVILRPTQPTGLQAIPLATLKAMAADATNERAESLAAAIAHMENQWNWIKDFVQRQQADIQVLLDREAVKAYAEVAAPKLNIRVPQIVRAIRAYLLGGLRQEGLLPAWERRGAPGKPRYPRANEDGVNKKSGRRNTAVIAGHADLLGPPATEDVREKLRLGYRKFKTSKAVSLETAYALTLGEFWPEKVEITDKGRKITLKPLAELPSLDQFIRHGRDGKAANSASRINLGDHRWERDHRPLPGSDLKNVVAAAQFGSIDSTSDDQNLVLGVDRTVEMPTSWNSKVVEGYTKYILGFYSGFERPSTLTALMAIAHAAQSKVEWCKRYGVDIREDDWMALHLRRIRGDNGEHKSEAGINTLSASDISTEFVESYAAERKGAVESKHHYMNRASGHQMAGSTLGEKRTRGNADPKKDACRTHEEYVYHSIKAIVYHNNVQRVERLLTTEMRKDKVEPTRAAILRWMLKKGYVATEAPNMAVVHAACLPALKGIVTRRGVQIFDPRSGEERLIPHLRYDSPALQATGLTSNGNSFRQEVTVHVHPGALGKAWLNYRGLVELDLKTHDVQLASLHLREWLAITDRDRLERFLSKGGRLQILANDGLERYDSNKAARKVKKQHEKDAKAEGRWRRSVTKQEAAALAQREELHRRLGLAEPLDESSAILDSGIEPADSANEPEWVIAARQAAAND